MKKKKGFTLIELLIVIAIIGILASIAYPSYVDSVKRSRRVDAQSALLGLAQALERFYTTEGTYLGASGTDAAPANTGAPRIFSTKSPIDGSSTFYNLKIQSAAVNTYIIGAEPVGAQVGDGVLILRSTGRRGWDANNTASGTLTIPGNASEIANNEWSW